MHPQKIIDLSVPIHPNFWEPTKVTRKIINHKQGADLLGKSVIQGKNKLSLFFSWLKYHFGARVDHRDFPEQQGLSLMHYSLSTHTGTHMDAPFHYGEKDQAGNPAMMIDEIPLSWCFADGVLIDVAKGQSSVVELDEVMTELHRCRYTLKPFDIVLLYTGSDRHVGKPAYFKNYRGVSVDVIEYFTQQGIKIIGIDSFSFDPPFQQMIQDYLRTKDKKVLWPSHLYGRNKPYCQLERLTNLSSLKNFSHFKVCCFPIKLKSADAAWCRVVAIVNHPQEKQDEFITT